MRKAQVACQLLLFVLPLVAQVPQRGVLRPSTPAPAGSYHALVIGIDAYQHENRLQTAVADAKAIEAVLRGRYGFQTKMLLDADATRDNILDAFGRYRRTLNENDSLLIYYAGHGTRDGEKAYWLPVDADPDSTAHWIIADDVTTGVRVMSAKHVLIISDSCYSGGISREAGANVLPDDHNAAIAKMLSNKSRVLIASGRDEPVADGGGSGHSVFASALIKGLSNANQESFSALNLFDNYVRESVIGNSSQVPLYEMIQNSGHDGGDFVFFPKTGVVVSSLPAAVPSARPAPARVTPAPVPTPNVAPSTPAPNPVDLSARTRSSPDPVIGCWQYNNVFSLTFFTDGRVTGFLDGGHWQQTAPNQYVIRWPPSIDTVTVVPGGRSLVGDNNYGGAGTLNAQRISNESAGLVGSWRWNNGVTVLFRGDGGAQAGPVGGKWTQSGANNYRIVWEFFFLDTLSLSADGRQLTGHNNVNIPVGGVRIPCAN